MDTVKTREYISSNRNRDPRKKIKMGENISFLARYFFDHPGATSREARKALCENNGIYWSTPTEMRGQYTSYFCTGWIGGASKWPRNPCGRYWRRVKRPDGKNGHLLTHEGLAKV